MKRPVTPKNKLLLPWNRLKPVPVSGESAEKWGFLRPYFTIGRGSLPVWGWQNLGVYANWRTRISGWRNWWRIWAWVKKCCRRPWNKSSEAGSEAPGGTFSAGAFTLNQHSSWMWIADAEQNRLSLAESAWWSSNHATHSGNCRNPIRYGCPRIHIQLRREGWRINYKKTHRIYCLEELNLRRKRSRRHATAMHRQQRPVLSHVDQCWSMDFETKISSFGLHWIWTKVKETGNLKKCVELKRGYLQLMLLIELWFCCSLEKIGRGTLREPWDFRVKLLTSELELIAGLACHCHIITVQASGSAVVQAWQYFL